MTEQPKRYGVLWDEKDYFDLLDCLHNGVTLGATCNILKRSSSGVQPKARRFGWEYNDNDCKPRKVCEMASTDLLMTYYVKWCDQQAASTEEKAHEQLLEGFSRPENSGPSLWDKAVKQLEDDYMNRWKEQYKSRIVRSDREPTKCVSLKVPWHCVDNFLVQAGNSALRVSDSGRAVSPSVIGMKAEDVAKNFEAKARQPTPCADDIADAMQYLLTEAYGITVNKSKGRPFEGAIVKVRMDDSWLPPVGAPKFIKLKSFPQQQPKETIMSFSALQFSVLTKTSFLFDGEDILYRSAAELCGYISTVENAITELRGLKTKSEAVDKRIAELENVATQLAAVLDNAEQLKAGATVRRTTVHNLETSTPNAQLQAENVDLRRENDILMRQVVDLQAQITQLRANG